MSPADYLLIFSVRISNLDAEFERFRLKRHKGILSRKFESFRGGGPIQSLPQQALERPVLIGHYFYVCDKKRQN